MGEKANSGTVKQLELLDRCRPPSWYLIWVTQQHKNDSTFTLKHATQNGMQQYNAGSNALVMIFIFFSFFFFTYKIDNLFS